MGFFKGIGRALGGGAKGFIASGGNPWAAAASAGMSLLGGGGGSGNAGMGSLNQIPGMAQGYLNPYTEEGRKAYNSLLDQYSNISDTNINQFPATYNKMAKDPATFLNDLMKGYEPSRGYNYQQNKMLGAARNSAASGGFAGTQYDQASQADLIRDLLGSDMGEYLKNVMGIQNSGLAGEERRLENRGRALGGMVNMGSNAAHDLANILGTNLSERAAFDFANQRQRRLNRRENEQDRSSLLLKLFDKGSGGNSIFDSLSSKLGSYF